MRKQVSTPTSWIACSIAILTWVAPGEALALQGGEDPATLPILIDKRFGERSRHQIGVNFTTQIASKFFEGTGVLASYGYNFSNLMGVELRGGFMATGEASIMDPTRCADVGTEIGLSDLHQLQWLAGAAFSLVPIYGKMSFASEFDPSWDLLLGVGAGVGGLKRQIGLSERNIAQGQLAGSCADVNRVPVRDYLGGLGRYPESFATKVTPIFDIGLALRFYFNKLVAMRIEIRDYLYPDPSAASYESGLGTLTFNLYFLAGLQVAFGGDQ